MLSKLSIVRHFVKVFLSLVVLSNFVNAEENLVTLKRSNVFYNIAIFNFENDTGQLGEEFSEIISGDLTRFGVFSLVDESLYSGWSNAFNQRPDFSAWRSITSDYLLEGSITLLGDRVKVDFHLWDTLLERQIAGVTQTVNQASYRSLAHNISDIVYQAVTGEAGYFNSRIVYVAESGLMNDRRHRLAIMDQDGMNHHYLTSGDYIVLAPRFSASQQELTYISYESGVPKVYLLDVDTRQQEVIGSFDGMTFAPRFSPDGGSIIMSMSKDGNTDIYSYNLATRSQQQITDTNAIDTSPSYSPDGRQIVFESDRDGLGQQLYVMNTDGSNVQRISFGAGNYASPVWSPTGDLIAYTRMYNNKFYIGVIKPDGSDDRLLTKDYLVESPSWSPNGHVIVFSRQRQGESSRKLYAIDIYGYFEKEITTPSDASDPSWSPNP